MKIAVTGVGGLVGAAIAGDLVSQGHEVVPVRFRLEAPRLQVQDFSGAQLLIHAAYDWQSRKPGDIQRINVNGSFALLDAAHAADIRNVIFISSVSAFVGCQSFYGKGKLQVEQRVLASGGLVIRPGMVFGDARQGIFGTLKRLARMPLLPVFDGGFQPLWFVHREDLASVVSLIVRREWRLLPSPVITVSADQPVTFREVLKTLGLAQGKQAAVFSIPSRLVLGIMRFIELLGLKLPLNSDGLMGLLESNPNPDFQTLRSLGVVPRALTQSTVL